jgi:hypothetical protein
MSRSGDFSVSAWLWMHGIVSGVGLEGVVAKVWG